MSINLQKGQKIDLTKGGTGLSKVMVGLGWDEAQLDSSKPQGFLAGLRRVNQDIDCDAVAFLLNKEGKIAEKKDVVYFNNLTHFTKCVIHQGDNLTGAGDGDDEQIMVDLSSLPSQYEKVVILVSIYDAIKKKQHFGMINNAFIRLVDISTNKEICIYNLSENYDNATALIFGELYRYNGEWKFNAIGQPLSICKISEIAVKYGLPKKVW